MGSGGSPSNALRQEKLQTIFGYFDEDNNGLWCFKEAAKAQRVTEGEILGLEDFEDLCGFVGASADTGMAIEHVTKIYNEGGDLILNRDYGKVMNSSIYNSKKSHVHSPQMLSPNSEHYGFTKAVNTALDGVDEVESRNGSTFRNPANRIDFLDAATNDGIRFEVAEGELRSIRDGNAPNRVKTLTYVTEEGSLACNGGFQYRLPETERPRLEKEIRRLAELAGVIHNIKAQPKPTRPKPSGNLKQQVTKLEYVLNHALRRVEYLEAANEITSCSIITIILGAVSGVLATSSYEEARKMSVTVAVVQAHQQTVASPALATFPFVDQPIDFHGEHSTLHETIHVISGGTLRTSQDSADTIQREMQAVLSTADKLLASLKSTSNTAARGRRVNIVGWEDMVRLAAACRVASQHGWDELGASISMRTDSQDFSSPHPPFSSATASLVVSTLSDEAHMSILQQNSEIRCLWTISSIHCIAVSYMCESQDIQDVFDIATESLSVALIQPSLVKSISKSSKDTAIQLIKGIGFIIAAPTLPTAYHLAYHTWRACVQLLALEQAGIPRPTTKPIRPPSSSIKTADPGMFFGSAIKQFIIQVDA